MGNKIKEFFITAWNHQVGSSIIATIIVGLLSFLFTIIYSHYTDNSLKESLINIGSAPIQLWIIILFFFIYMIASYIFNLLVGEKFVYDDETLELDRELFIKITKELLRQDFEVYFLRTSNLAGFSFNPDLIDGLHHYHGKINNSDFEFLNPLLQEIHIELAEYIEVFLETIGKNTFPTGMHWQTVPPEWETDDPERFEKTVNTLHKQKINVCVKYDELVRNGRRLLKV